MHTRLYYCLCSEPKIACCLCRLKELEAAAEHLQAALLAELNASASGAGAVKKKGRAKKGKKKQVGITARAWKQAQCMLRVHCMHPFAQFSCAASTICSMHAERDCICNSLRMVTWRLKTGHVFSSAQQSKRRDVQHPRPEAFLPWT